FSMSCPFRVRNNITPVGNPSTKPKNPETNVITTVSHVPFNNNIIIASDISQFRYGDLMVFKELNGFVPELGGAEKRNEHDSKLNAGDVIKLRADNLKIQPNLPGHIRQNRCGCRMARDLQF